MSSKPGQCYSSKIFYANTTLQKMSRWVVSCDVVMILKMVAGRHLGFWKKDRNFAQDWRTMAEILQNYTQNAT